jgi:esterase/lipase superfamily enzyme
MNLIGRDPPVSGRTAEKPSDQIVLGDRPARLGQIVMFAPDMDAGEFNSACFRGMMNRNVERITIYSQRDDKALIVASKLSGLRRAGSFSSDGPEIRTNCADIIDVTAANGADSDEVLDDFAHVLRFGLPPHERSAAMRRVSSPRGQYWQLVQ